MTLKHMQSEVLLHFIDCDGSWETVALRQTHRNACGVLFGQSHGTEHLALAIICGCATATTAAACAARCAAAAAACAARCAAAAAACAARCCAAAAAAATCAACCCAAAAATCAARCCATAAAACAARCCAAAAATCAACCCAAAAAACAARCCAATAAACAACGCPAATATSCWAAGSPAASAATAGTTASWTGSILFVVVQPSHKTFFVGLPLHAEGLSAADALEPGICMDLLQCSHWCMSIKKKAWSHGLSLTKSGQSVARLLRYVAEDSSSGAHSVCICKHD